MKTFIFVKVFTISGKSCAKDVEVIRMWVIFACILSQFYPGKLPGLLVDEICQASLSNGTRSTRENKMDSRAGICS